MNRTSLLALAFLVTVWLSGCDWSGIEERWSSSEEEQGPTPAHKLHLQVATQESEYGRNLMLIGEEGYAEAEAWGWTTDSDGDVVEDIVDPGPISFTSSDPAIVSVNTVSSVNPRHQNAVFMALAVGSVKITASVQGLTDERRVDVVAAPLPVDSFSVRLATLWMDNLPFSSGDVADFNQGRLERLLVPAGDSIVFYVRVERYCRSGNGQTRCSWVTKIPFTLTSSKPDVASILFWDPYGGPFSREEHFKIHALTPGESTITVTVRNKQVTFVVQVN